MPTVDRNSRKYLDGRKAAMKTERQSFIPHWRDISDFIQRHRNGRKWLIADVPKGRQARPLCPRMQTFIDHASSYQLIRHPARPSIVITVPCAACHGAPRV